MFHTQSFEDVVAGLETSAENGLSKSVVELRLAKFGLNELPSPKKRSLIFAFLDEFKDLLVLLLVGATIISFAVGETVDAIAILCIVIINATLGFIQEYKAEKAIEALKKLSTTHAKVIRGGETLKIEAKDLVPGDIILVEAGDKIPADARLIESFSLEVSEAPLTGESVPVKKNPETLTNEHCPLGDKVNMLFKDTSVTYGRGKAVVVATAINTEVGKISTLLKEGVHPQTPLQKALEKVGKNLSAAALLIIGVIFLTEVFYDFIDLRTAFLTSVSLAVAAIPEGLPAVITLVLAIGVTRLAKAKAIIRKLPAVETLGATTYILTDKTGTLTQNRMVVKNIFTSKQKEYFIAGEGYKPEGDFSDTSGTKLDPATNEDLMDVLQASLLCNDSVLNFNEEKNGWEVVGDITEGALIVVAEKGGLNHKEMLTENKRVFEVPFSSDNKFMVTAHEVGKSGTVIVTMKGAPEVVLGFSSNSQQEKDVFLAKTTEYSSQALRNIGFAVKILTKAGFDKKDIYSNLKFIGIVAQKDPLRVEAHAAVQTAKAAGIVTVMVTGDHKLTASAIARELGILENDSQAITGEELQKIPPAEFDEVVFSKRVFARVSPEQKLKLVEAFRRMKQIVAVTGDGVNDAPALHVANIGIAMGIEGTDVAKETSDMVLQDDNFATIVSAVKEGRIVFDNLIKFVTYLISCNISEILVIFFATVQRLPLPLLPIHLLWINLVTDGFPALALGMEPGEADVMERKPRNTKDGILTKKRWFAMAIEGLVIGITTYLAYRYALPRLGLSGARTVAFLSLSVAQLVHSLNSRTERGSLFKVGILKNKPLFYTFIISIVIQYPVIYTKFGEVLFEASPLPPFALYNVGLVALATLVSVEFIKIIRRFKKAV